MQICFPPPNPFEGKRCGCGKLAVKLYTPTDAYLCRSCWDKKWIAMQEGAANALRFRKRHPDPERDRRRMARARTARERYEAALATVAARKAKREEHP